MNARILTGAGLVVATFVGVMVFLQWREGSESQERVSKILHAVELELENGDELDTGELGSLLRRIAAESKVGGSSPELRRAEARIRLALGSPNEAWELIADSAMSPEGAAADRWIGARALMRLHAEQGDIGKGRDAIGLARSYYDATSDVEALFVVWQLAYRTDSIADWLEAGVLLRDRHADTLEGETAAATEHFLAEHLLTRRGIVGSREQLEQLKGSTSDREIRDLLDRYFATVSTAENVSWDSMLELDRRWGRTPPELTVLLARAQIVLADRDGNQDDLHQAVDLLNIALARYPTFVEARHLAALGHYGLEQQEQRQSYLRWLVENAPETDARRRSWREQLR